MSMPEGADNERTAADLRNGVEAAAQRIAPYIRATPLEHSPALGRAGACTVSLKLECLQLTGSFKLRGAGNRLLQLDAAERRRGIIAASTGNHGVAVAHMAGELGIETTVFSPTGASSAKLDHMRQLGVELSCHGTDCVEAELLARRTADESGRVFISPYNDRQVICGQGTIGLEIGRPDVVLAPVGGGGLISGVAAALKAVAPDTEVIGCQPARSAVMQASLAAGRIVEPEPEPTLSDGTAGGIEPGSITVALCAQLVDRWIAVEEEQIAAAIRLVIEQHGLLIEGAAALPVAAFLRALDDDPECFRDRSVVLVLSGSRISLETLRKVLGC